MKELVETTQELDVKGGTKKPIKTCDDRRKNLTPYSSMMVVLINGVCS